MRTAILTPKQNRFIDEYMVDLNGAAAAERAKYSKKTSRAIAAENLAKPYIKAELQRRQAALARELEITRTHIVQGFLAAFEMAKANRQPGIMVSSMVAIAKLLNLYAVEATRVELTPAQLAVRNRYQSMSDNELYALAARARA